jgi:transposase InsO family protein
MLQLIHNLCLTLLISLRSRHDLLIENLALRQQLSAFTSRNQKPRVRPTDRLFWSILSLTWSGWTNALVFVKPGTVIRWHGKALRSFWSFISRRRSRLGRRPLTNEIRELIRQMARDGWGAPRIHGELLLLGFDVSERTVSRYLEKIRRRPASRQGWITFLHNHKDVIAAMDFCLVFSATFKPLFVWFAIDHGRRKVLHINVTAHPTSRWVIQQLREAFPFDTAARYLIFDRDSIFSSTVRSFINTLGMKPSQTAFRCPWQNPVAERFVGTLRRDLLDHVIAFDENHLRRLISDYLLYYYLLYYHDDRIHLGLAKQTPDRRQISKRPSPDAEVVALPRVRGLHHRYEWKQAA